MKLIVRFLVYANRRHIRFLTEGRERGGTFTSKIYPGTEQTATCRRRLTVVNVHKKFVLGMARAQNGPADIQPVHKYYCIMKDQHQEQNLVSETGCNDNLVSIQISKPVPTVGTVACGKVLSSKLNRCTNTAFSAWRPDYVMKIRKGG